MGGSPTSGAGTAAGYIGSLLGGLKKGFEERRGREEKGLAARGEIVFAQVELAKQKSEATPGDPVATTAYADALKDYDKFLKEMEKHYQPDKTLWGRMKDLLGRGGKPPAGNQPVGAAVPAPAPQLPPGVTPTFPSPVAAQARNPYQAMAEAQARTGQEGQRMAGMQREVDIGEFQAKLRAQGASEEQAGGVAKIVTTHQLLSRGRIDLDQAIRDVQDGAVRATDGKPAAAQQAALDLLHRARLDPRFKDRIPEIDQKLDALQEGIAVRPGYMPREPGAYRLDASERKVAISIPGWDYSKPPHEQTPEVQVQWNAKGQQNLTAILDASDALEKQRLASAARQGRAGGARSGKSKWDVWEMRIRQYINTLKSGQGMYGVRGFNPTETANKIDRLAQYLIDAGGETLPEGESPYMYIVKKAGEGYGEGLGTRNPAVPAPVPTVPGAGPPMSATPEAQMGPALNQIVP